MNQDVFKTSYEIVGSGVEIAVDFYAKVEEAIKAHWAVANEFGADGYRPSHNGHIRSLLFKEGSVPSYFRKVGRDMGRIEAVPHKGSKAGKEAAAKLADVQKKPSDKDLADLFGWEGRSPIDGYKIYYPTATDVVFPTRRFLLRLPRQAGDGWVQPDTLKAIPESEFMRALEDHNAIVRSRQSEAA